MAYELKELLEQAYMAKASDVHLTVGIPPIFRIDGELKPHGSIMLMREDLERLVDQLIPSQRKEELMDIGALDFNYSLENICRFRVNVFQQKEQFAIAARTISSAIPSIESLQMPDILYSFCQNPHGLILVTGPTGSGKTTTLAAMVDEINRTQAKHIVTLEDPIEYLHTHQQSIVNQREIGTDTRSFADGLRSALRQDPDVILVGEMRDLETISTAITAAETGHLVMATLHTSSAPTTIDRIIDVFPPHQQRQIRIQLANVLQGIISQRLFKRKSGKGRIAATEILVRTPSIMNLIRNEKVHQIHSIMQTSRDLGMQTLDFAIKSLLVANLIDKTTVQQYVRNED